MKVFVTALILFACSSLLAEDNFDACYNPAYNSCQESLDYDYTSEEQQIENELLCEYMSKSYCEGKLSYDEFKNAVSELAFNS